MSKTRLRFHTILVAIVVSAAFLMLPAVVHATANPTSGYMPVKYRDTAGGATYTANRSFGNCLYSVANTGWCVENHTTNAATPRKYDHFHFTSGFPFTDTTRSVSVTTTKANYAYDASHPGWTRSGTPTCSYNCHGYAMGQASAPCIRSSTNGSDRWRTDEGYTSISEPTSSCIHSTTTHSYKILGIYPCDAPDPDHVKTKKEKDSPSAIYEITLSSPGEHDTTDLYDD
jgi:hypothetical protein